MTNMVSLRVNSFDLGPMVSVNNYLIPETNDKCYRRYSLIRTPQLEGEDKWKISDGSSVFSKRNKDFIYEPLPSSRTDKFIKDTRFDTIEEAVIAMQKYRTRMTEFYLSKGLTYWYGDV